MSSSYFARILVDARRPLPHYTPDTLGQEPLVEIDADYAQTAATQAAGQIPCAAPVTNTEVQHQEALDKVRPQNLTEQPAHRPATPTTSIASQTQALGQPAANRSARAKHKPEVQPNPLRGKAAPLQIRVREPAQVSANSRYSVIKPQAAAATATATTATTASSAVELPAATLPRASIKADPGAKPETEHRVRVESSIATVQPTRLEPESALPVIEATGTVYSPVKAKVAQPARYQASALPARASSVNSTPVTNTPAPQLHIGELLLRVIDQAPVPTASAPLPTAEPTTRVQSLTQRGADSRTFTRTL